MRLASLACFSIVSTTLLSSSLLSAPPKPKPLSPEQLLAAAADHNGLGDKATAPWHLVASFQSFGDDGAPKDSGTFEEWWFSPSSYKSIYKSSQGNQPDVAPPAGLFRAGDQSWTTRDQNLAPQLLLAPLGFQPSA